MFIPNIVPPNDRDDGFGSIRLVVRIVGGVVAAVGLVLLHFDYFQTPAFEPWVIVYGIAMLVLGIVSVL